MAWEYFQPKKLSIRAAKNTTNGTIMTADKVIYSKEECRIISSIGGLDPVLHGVKKIFDGEIVSVDDEK